MTQAAGVRVIPDGTHVVTNAHVFARGDSNAVVRAEHPGKAVLVGGPVFRGADFRPYRGRGFVLDLPAGWHDAAAKAKCPQLAVDARAMTRARWPNEDTIRIGAEHYVGDRRHVRLGERRLASWDFSRARIRVFGMFGEYWSSERAVTGYDAATDTLSFDEDVSEGARVFFYGVPEEIDRPGEWAYDYAAHRILLCPDAAFNADSVVAFGVSDTGFAKIAADNVTFEGIVFAAASSGATAVTAKGCSGTRFLGCRFSALAGDAVELGGRNGLVRSCDFVDVDGCGVRVSGGSRLTLEPGSNRVDNCFFDRPCARRAGFGVGAVNLDGVDNTVSHCLIRHTREHALDWTGIGCVVEYCRMYDANNDFRDSAVCYSRGCGEHAYGNVFRFNDLAGSPGHSQGIYPDDFSSGNLIYGNIVRNVGWSGVFLGGGRDNVVSNNVIVSPGMVALHVDNRGLCWPAWTSGRDGWLRSAKGVTGYPDGPVCRRYPRYGRWTNDCEYAFGYVDNEWVNNIVIDGFRNAEEQVLGDRRIPLGRQTSRGNVSVGLRLPPATDVWRFGGFTTLDVRGNPGALGFRDVPACEIFSRADGHRLFTWRKGDFTFAADSALAKAAPGFRPIPWDRIGLYRDAWRTELPVEDEVNATGPSHAPVGNEASGRLFRVTVRDFSGSRYWKEGPGMVHETEPGGEVSVRVPSPGEGTCRVWAHVLPGSRCEIRIGGTSFSPKANGLPDVAWEFLGTTTLPEGDTADVVLRHLGPGRSGLRQIVLTLDPSWQP